ncbi:MAG: hypothetical protein IJ209_04180 [Bacteroidaceae bacterium]|nr:hypothetical protein [Bacteroidaceae bacterium]
MSKAKKELRAKKKAEREARQAKRVIQWIICGLVVLFIVCFIGWAFIR